METQQHKTDYEVTVLLGTNQEMVVYLNDKTTEQLKEFVDKTKARHPEARIVIDQKKNTFLNNNGN
jgi:hypothetical protein